jgi:hypothetical protein
MNKRLSLLAALLVLTVATVTPAGAVTGGTVDGTTHPEVGAIVADYGNGLRVHCSGTLVSPRVFLSAGHCAAALAANGVDPHDVFVTFDPAWDPTAPGTAYRGTYHIDPDYGYSGQGGASDPHDLMVIVLDEPVAIPPAELPSLRAVGRLDLGSSVFTAVGYGRARDVKTGGPNALYFDGARRWVEQAFLSLQPSWLSLSENFSTDSGGSCAGDSGGPHFYGGAGSDKLASITISGDAVCRALDKTYRLDTASAFDFLSGFTQYGAYTHWG